MTSSPSITETKPTSFLATKNPHSRDAYIHFDEGPHKYTIQGINGVTAETEFTSVTTVVHQHFEHFDAKKVIAAMMRNQKKWNDPVANAKYYGKTTEEIEEMWKKAGQDAAAKGTAMHYNIECFYNTLPPHAPDATTDAPATTDTPVTTDTTVTADTTDAPDTTDTTDTPDTTDTADTPDAPDAPDAPDTRTVSRRGGADPPELEYFKKFHNDFVAGEQANLRPYRTEWTVFHEEAQIAGSIDMVYEDLSASDTRRWGADTPLAIYDWKRCREIAKTNRANKFATHPAIEHLPDTNYWHYALQLNIYKYILQTKYDRRVTDLYIVVLHPEAQNYQRIKLPDLQSEVAELFEERIQYFAAAATK
jgi:hypothetical protein